MATKDTGGQRQTSKRSEETEEADPKTTPWSPIVPGTREETNFTWACDQRRTAGAK